MHPFGHLFIAYELASGALRSVLVLGALAAFVTFMFFGALRPFLGKRRIQPGELAWKDLCHDAAFTVLNLTVASSGGLFVAYLLRIGVAHVELGPVHWYVPIGQFLIYFLTFDLYFYGLHRLLHTRWLYQKIHRFHHHSSAPTPMTAYAFHPIEGLISGQFVTLLMVVMGLHLYAVVAIYAYGILSSVFIHGGHEVFPRWWYRRRGSAWLLTPTFHDVHHSQVGCNYGGFMTIWDRVFKTVHPEFDAIYAEVSARASGQPRMQAESAQLTSEAPRRAA